jgi:hypothetical protein
MLPDSPAELRLHKMLVDNSSGLTTEGIIQAASQLSDGETILCTTPLTPIVKLMVNLDNQVRTKDIIDVTLKVLNNDLMHNSLPFRLQPAHTLIQMARLNGRSRTDPGKLSMEDVVSIFGLDASSIWHLWGYNIKTGDSTHCFRLRERYAL